MDYFKGIRVNDGLDQSTQQNYANVDYFKGVKVNDGLEYKPEEHSFLGDTVDKIKKQWDTTSGNLMGHARAWGAEIKKAADEIDSAVLARKAIPFQAKKDMYDTLIATPAGYIAMTPGVPGNIRGVAGALYAPKLLSDVGESVVRNSQTNGVVGTTGNVAKEFLVDPIVNPVNKWSTDPIGTAAGIKDDPMNIFPDVFLATSMAHGAVKGAKGAFKVGTELTKTHAPSVYDTASEITRPAREAVSDIKGEIKSHIPQNFDYFKNIKVNDGIETKAVSNIDYFKNIKVNEGLTPRTDINGMETGDLKTDIYNRLRQHGLTDAQSAGLVGNIAQESQFDVKALSDDGYNTKGLVQWDAHRHGNLEKFARATGGDINDWRTQTDFIVHELTRGEEGNAWSMLQDPDLTPEESAHIVREFYERPDPEVANDAYRQQVAREVYDNNGGQKGVYRGREEFNEPIENTEKEHNVSNLDPLEKPNGNLKGNLDAIERITPEQLSEKLRDGTIPQDVFREYNYDEYKRTTQLNPKEKIDYAVKETQALKNGITDKQGETVKVVFDEINKNAIEDIAKRFIRSNDKTTIADKRVFATHIIKDTVQHPDFTVLQKNGEKAYIGFWKGIDGVTHEIIVSMDKADKGKIITSFATGDKYHDWQHTFNQLVEDVKKSNTIIDIGDNVRANLSEYPKPSASDMVSTPDTKFRSSGSSVIPQEKEFAMYGGISDLEYNNGEQSKPVSRREILDTIKDEFNKIIKHGRVGKKSAGGWFNNQTEAIRTQDFADPRVMTHELGHYLDKKHNFSNNPKYNQEFISEVKNRFGTAYNKLDDVGLRKEGFAEFFHDYTSKRSRAKERFPNFYKEFETRLAQDKELNGAVNKLSSLVHTWNKQSPEQRLKGSISWDYKSGAEQLMHIIKKEGIKSPIRKLFNKLYTDWVDELNPLNELVKEVEKRTGEKISSEDNPFLQATASRGFAGKAKKLLEYGDKEHGVKALYDIFEMVGKDKLKDLSAYSVALHIQDFFEWNKRELTAGRKDKLIKHVGSPKDIELSIQKYSKDTALVNAHRELIKYQDNLMRMAVDSGIVSEKTALGLKAKYPNYVPFYRELGDLTAESFFSSGKGFVNVGDIIKQLKESTKDIINPLVGIGKNTIMFTKAIELNEVGKRIAKLSELEGMGDVIEKVIGTPSSKDSVFYVWEHGEKQAYATRPELYNAFKMLDDNSASFIEKMMIPISNSLRIGATIVPDFALANILRDTVSATIYSKNGFIPVVDNIKGLAHYLSKDDVYQEWLSSGADQATHVSTDINSVGRQMERVLNKTSKTKTATQLLKTPRDVLFAFSSALENSTRLGEYVNARKGYTGYTSRFFNKNRKIRSVRDAGLESRDITLDFGRHGRLGKHVNRVVPFFNASIQGLDKMVREFKARPAEMMLKSAIIITIPSIVSWYLCKDDERYQEVPQWEKDGYWFIPTKDTLYKIPKPQEYGILFGSGTERFLQMCYDKDKNITGVGFKGFAESLSENLLPDIMPLALSVFSECTSNYSRYRQQNIVPLSEQNLPDELQYGPYTSYIARKFGEMTGTSPRKVDHVIHNVLGNAGGYLTYATDKLAGYDKHRPEQKFTETPGIKRFVVTPNKHSASYDFVNNTFKEQQKLYNAYQLTGNKPKDFDETRWGLRKDVNSVFRNIAKAERAIMKSEQLTPKEKRERLDELNVIKVNISRRMLGRKDLKKS